MNIPILSKLLGIADKATDIAKEAVVDKDKQNELVAHIAELTGEAEKAVYLAELQTKTVPWVDGLHKMGRQLSNLLTIAAVVVLSLAGIEITPTMALVLTGGNVTYQYIKGKGQ